MSLLRILAERGDIPSRSHAAGIASGETMPPIRGFVPWGQSSGFEGTQKQMLQEMMRVLQARGQIPAETAQRLSKLFLRG
jgi:hypothetical protein